MSAGKKVGEFEEGLLAGASMTLVVVVLLLALFPRICRAAEPEGPLDLVLRFSHHVYASGGFMTPQPKEQDYVDLLDQVAVVPGFRTAEACHAAGLEAQARFQRPERNAYVDFTCAYLGSLRGRAAQRPPSPSPGS